MGKFARCLTVLILVGATLPAMADTWSDSAYGVSWTVVWDATSVQLQISSSSGTCVYNGTACTAFGAVSFHGWTGSGFSVTGPATGYADAGNWLSPVQANAANASQNCQTNAGDDAVCWGANPYNALATYNLSAVVSGGTVVPGNIQIVLLQDCKSPNCTSPYKQLTTISIAQPSSVPEGTSLAMLGAALPMIGFWRRR